MSQETLQQASAALEAALDFLRHAPFYYAEGDAGEAAATIVPFQRDLERTIEAALAALGDEKLVG